MKPLPILLWTAAVLFYVFGDMVTTYIGIEKFGNEERNPLARRVLESEYGYFILFILKILVVLVVAFFYLTESNIKIAYAHVGILVLAGVVATIWNSIMISAKNRNF